MVIQFADPVTQFLKICCVRVGFRWNDKKSIFFQFMKKVISKLLQTIVLL